MSTTQAQPALDPDGGTAEGTPKVERSNLETFYMVNKDGKLIGMFKIPFEDFDEIYARYKGYESAEKRKRYALHTIEMDGSASGDTAVLKVKFVVTTKVAGWVRVPLRLKDFVLRGVDKPNNATDRFLEFDEDGDGYVWWIRGEENKRYVMTLTVAKRLRIAGGQYYLSLNATPAPSQELKLRVPHTPERLIDPSLSENAELSNSRSVSNKETELTVLWNGASLDLGWRNVENKGDPKSPTLEVDGNIFVRFDGQREVHCRAELDVRAISGEIRTFDVRLPLGMTLDESEVRPGYTITKVNAPANPALGQRVRVRLAQSTQNAPELILTASKVNRRGAPNALQEIGGFEVVGAALQSGFYNLAIEDDWSLKVIEGPNVRREENIAEDLTFEDVKVVARFGYDAQPCSLQVQPIALSTTSSIHPKYLFLVDENQIELRATLNCRMRGPRANQIPIDLTGWMIEEVGERNLIDMEKTKTDAVSPFDIFLSSSAPKTGQLFEITIRAIRPLDSVLKNGILTLDIPASDDSFSGASVAISSDSHLMLSNVKTQGLIDDTAASKVSFTKKRQPALFYREVPGSNEVTFVSSFEKRDQSISVATTAHTTVAPQSITVRQQHHFRVDYVPLGILLFDVPKSLLEKERNLTLAIGQQELDPKELQSIMDLPPDWTRLRVQLDNPLIDSFDIDVSYELPLSAGGEKSQVVEVPLSTPAATNTLAARFEKLFVVSDETLDVVLDSEQWVAEEESPASEIGFTPKSQSSRSSVQLTIAKNEKLHGQRTVIDVAWIQTWLTRTQRQERAVFRVTTQDDSVHLRLPPGGMLNGLLLDGEPLSRVAKLDSGDITIDFSGDPLKPNRVIEVRYSFQNRDSNSSGKFDLPQLVESSWTRRCYWQLIMPSDEHLLTAPGNLTPELAWTWRDFYWSRQANRDQRSLEKLSGARQEPSLPDTTNQYLFSSFGEIPNVQFSSAPRLAIMLVVSLTTMGGLLVVIYYPVLRHPGTLVVVAVVLISLGFVMPHAMLAAAQIAILSVFGIVCVTAMRWIFERPRQERVRVRGTSHPTIDATTETYAASPSDFGSNASTHLGQVAVHVEQSTHSAGSGMP